ncbi:hypothetical protein HMN09_00440600 [Mycena chlorophos]|uniref:DUF2855 family protein n=1 Tax=Mycena chlorophos TaxID=658473 RepID=A0A8H6TDX8_MYCCL|nr:hypothetical protein HMN09_00440600 [Mycena chlorophos]
MQNLSLCVQRPSAPSPGKDHAVVASSLVPTQPLPDNHVVIRVERFGWSANNVTYEALGEQAHFRYFDFHSAPQSAKTSPETHGLVPVWGFGTIVASSHPKIAIGERIYGYLAPCRYLLCPVSPSDVNRHAFYVPRPHLPAGIALHPVASVISLYPDRRPYNQIIRCANDPEYTPTPLGEALTMLYRPLFFTAYWLTDWLHTQNFHGATAVLISSASAKTAFCAAYLIRKRRARGEANTELRIVGLTSKRNIAFTRGLGLYDEVVEYDELESKLSTSHKWLYVDVAGNDPLNARLFKHLNSKIVSAVALGMTSLAPASEKAASLDWQTNTFSAVAKSTAAAQLQFESFFMVEWLNVRKHQLSMQEIFRRQKEAWVELMRDCVPWVHLVHVSGADAVKRAYDDVAKTGFSPDVGYIWSLWNEPGKDAKL